MEKKKTTKKPAAKKEVVKKEVINNEVTVKNQVDYTNLLSKIFYALVVIGVLLALNLCVNLIVNSKSNSNSTTKKTTTTTEDGEYDVSEFETLTTSELIDKITDGGTQVVYIGRSTCGYCAKFLPPSVNKFLTSKPCTVIKQYDAIIKNIEKKITIEDNIINNKTIIL